MVWMDIDVITILNCKKDRRSSTIESHCTAVLFSLRVETLQTRNHHGMSMQIRLGDCNVTSAGGVSCNHAALYMYLVQAASCPCDRVESSLKIAHRPDED